MPGRTRCRSSSPANPFPHVLGGHGFAGDVGERIQILVARAQASGVDADAAVREALRSLEERIRQAEGVAGTA